MSEEMSSYFDQWNSTIARPANFGDQRFGVVLESGDIVSPLILPLNTVYIGKGLVPNYSRQLRSQSGRSDKGSTVVSNKNKYEISLDVQHFEPNELTVKVNGNNIIIEGNHQEKQDAHGSVSRQFVRKYWVPKNHNLNKVSSNLSSDGILTVSVARSGDANEDRVIPILHTRALAKLNDNEDGEKPDDDKCKEKRVKKVEEKQDEKLEDKQEEQWDENQEDKRKAQKEEDEKKD